MLKNEKTKSQSKREAIQEEEKLDEVHQSIGESRKAYGKVLSEKEKLLELYKTLKDLGINSIGDLEVKISRL